MLYMLLNQWIEPEGFEKYSKIKKFYELGVKGDKDQFYQSLYHPLILH